MSLMENMGPADVAAVVGNNRNGNGFFGGADGGWFWIVILFLFAMFGNNGWGNNGGNNAMPVVLANGGFGGGSTQQIIDQQSVMNGLGNIQTQLSNGFSNAEISRCNANANVLQAINGIGMSLQNCCCENRANIADLKYTVATENCADRTAAAQNTRDIIDTINNKVQGIQDKLCQLEMDGMKQNYEAQLRQQAAQIQALQSQVQNQAFIASQNQQTAELKADNATQTVALEQYLNPTAVPAYIVQNPNCCGQAYNYGYGCNGRRVA